MALQFAILGSGSAGNSALIRVPGASGLLIDFGFGARDLTRRLHGVSASWSDIRAALLTHTHGDHVNIACLTRLFEHEIPLYCHEGQRANLQRFGIFGRMEDADLVRFYDDQPFLVPCGFRVEPIELSHDGGPTYGFRVEGRGGRRARPSSIGYLADSGLWNDRMVDALTEVDVLGVEFNHDVEMQKKSGRAPSTIARNLGRFGHLSNDQAAAFVTEILKRSGSRGPRQLVMLHLSRQCNLARLALDAAKNAVKSAGRRITIHVAEQYYPSPILMAEPGRGTKSAKARVAEAAPAGMLPF